MTRPDPQGGGPVGFGVVGGRSFVATRAVLPAIDLAPSARLAAIASRSGAIDERWAATAVADYESVLSHPDVDAVYVPLPNDLHREWAERAAAAGKHVLCEKPLAPDAATARVIASACADAGVLLAEAWMTPFDPRWQHALGLARAGEIGEIVEIEATFTFTIPASASANYRWHPEHGGGALLDVGIYCLGAAVELWGTEATVDRAEVVPSPTAPGVDATTTATVSWSGGRRATIRCSFTEPERQRLVYQGSAGRIVLDGDAFTGGGDLIVVERNGRSERRPVAPGDPYLGMVERFAAAVAGRAEWPRPVERSIEVLDLLDRIRRAGRASTDHH